MKAKYICHHCGGKVAPDNNNLFLGVEAEKIKKYGPDYEEERVDRVIYSAIYFSRSEHIFPVMDGDKVVCPGVPSRAQYLGEQYPKQDDYNAEDENILRPAYRRMLAWAAAMDKNAPRA